MPWCGDTERSTEFDQRTVKTQATGYACSLDVEVAIRAIAKEDQLVGDAGAGLNRASGSRHAGGVSIGCGGQIDAGHAGEFNLVVAGEVGDGVKGTQDALIRCGKLEHIATGAAGEDVGTHATKQGVVAFVAKELVVAAF